MKHKLPAAAKFIRRACRDLIEVRPEELELEVTLFMERIVLRNITYKVWGKYEKPETQNHLRHGLGSFKCQEAWLIGRRS